jgi:uncharacterized protein (TIGR04255 family)
MDSSDFDDIKYSTNYLKEVICRIDFASPLSDNKIFNESVIKTIEKHFSIPDMDRILNMGKINIETENPAFNVTSFIEKNFFNDNKTKKCSLCSQHLSINIFNYRSFEELFEILNDILDVLYRVDSSICLKRFGLRYINDYQFSGEKKLYSFTKYFNTKLLSSYNFLEYLEDNIFPSRAINLQEFICKDLRLKFQFGMYNPDYPAIIKKKHFVLDYDCYFNGIIDNKSEIISKLISSHESIQYLFELSISKKLREEMRDSNG